MIIREKHGNIYKIYFVVNSVWELKFEGNEKKLRKFIEDNPKLIEIKNYKSQ